MESKATESQLRGSESYASCKWLKVSMYYFGSTHAYYQWKEVQGAVGFLEKLAVTMPNYLYVDLSLFVLLV